jgi:CDP-diacylglycerol--glycerol-3-phosphate 3-phosphatidyltransferase
MSWSDCITSRVNSRDPKKLFPHDYLMKYTLIPLIPQAVTPNSITLLRFFGIPALIFLLAQEWYDWSLGLFLFLALTDAVDGSLARLRDQITQWGTIYDPVADKLLIGSVVLLIVMKHINVILGLLILIVEGLIILGAMRRRKAGHAIAANFFGKTKMFLQVLGVTFLLIAVWLGFDLFVPLSIGTLCLAILFAVVSLFTYGW